VTARKVSHCSKSADRANAYAAFKTIIETARKRGKSLVSGLMDSFRSDIRHLIRFLPTPLPVHPDNLQPSGDASPQNAAAREAALLINYEKTTNHANFRE